MSTNKIFVSSKYLIYIVVLTPLLLWAFLEIMRRNTLKRDTVYHNLEKKSVTLLYEYATFLINIHET